MAVMINKDVDYESMYVVLTKEKTPIAYNNKIKELVADGCYNSVEEAENDNTRFEIELELYYDQHNGLFAVEVEAIESLSDTLVSPYTGEKMVNCEE